MARIVITRGRNYDLTIVVKGPSSVTPLEMTGTATAIIYFNSKGFDSELILEKEMVRIGASADGKFLVSLTPEETFLFPFDVILPEDGEQFASTCRGHVAITDTDHVNPALHHMDVLLPDIYVSDIGLTPPGA